MAQTGLPDETESHYQDGEYEQLSDPRVLPGDSIGPEVMAGAIKVLEKVQTKFSFSSDYDRHDVGSIAIDNHGTAAPGTIKGCRSGRCSASGSMGGPRWAPAAQRSAGRGACLPLPASNCSATCARPHLPVWSSSPRYVPTSPIAASTSPACARLTGGSVSASPGA